MSKCWNTSFNSSSLDLPLGPNGDEQRLEEWAEEEEEEGEDGLPLDFFL